MQHERPLLTIAIPTYNRAKCFRELLATICGQLIGHPNVELLVSDNASSDATPDVIAEFMSQGLELRYIRNKANVGADANFLQCFEQARGKYLWLFGDDDIIVPGSLDKLLPMLAGPDYALIYLCPYPFRDDWMAGRQHDRFGRFGQVIPNGSPFMRILGPMISFISALIVNKERYEASPGPRLESLVGSNLIQLGWSLPVLASGGENLIIWDKVLAARVGNSGGYGICRVFSNTLDDLLTKTLPGNEEIREILVNINLREWFPTTIIQIRFSTAGAMEEEDFHKLLQPLHSKNWRYWVYVFPVISLPPLPARLWWAGTQSLNRAGRLLGLIFSYPKWNRSQIRSH